MNLHKKVLSFVSILFIFTLIILYYAKSLDGGYIGNIFNADVTFLHVLFKDLFTDNYLLSDWTFPNSPGYFPDFLLFTLSNILGKTTPQITFIYSLLQWALILIVLMYLYKLFFPQNKNTYFGLLIVLFSIFFLCTILPLNINSFSFYLMHPTYHTNVLINTVIAFILLLLLIKYNGFSYSFLLFFIVVLGTISDKIFILVFVLPSITAMFFLKPDHWIKSVITIFVASLSGYLFNEFIISDIITTNNTAKSFHFSFNNLLGIVHFFNLYMYGNIYEQLIVYLSFGSFISAVIALLFNHKEQNFIQLYIYFYVFLFVFVLFPPFILGYYTGNGLRYLIFIFYFSFINIPLLIYKIRLIRNKSVTVFSFFAILSILIIIFIKINIKTIPEGFKQYLNFKPDYVKFVDDISQKYDLKIGIGDYWKTHPLILFSEHENRIYSVYTSSLIPNVPVSNNNWYYNTDHGSYNNPIFNYILINKNKIKKYEYGQKVHIDTIFFHNNYALLKTKPFKFLKNNDNIFNLSKLKTQSHVTYDLDSIEKKLTHTNPSIDHLNGYQPASYKNNKFFFNGFGDSIPADTLLTKHAQKASNPRCHLLFEDKNELLYEGDEYEFSFWFYNKGQNKARIHCIVAQTNSKNKERWTDHFNINTGIQIYKDWMLVKYKFHTLKDAKNVKILILGENSNDYPIYYDDFLIREKDLDVYYKINDNHLFYNNYRIPIK